MLKLAFPSNFLPIHFRCNSIIRPYAISTTNSVFKETTRNDKNKKEQATAEMFLENRR